MLHAWLEHAILSLHGSTAEVRQEEAGHIGFALRFPAAPELRR
ncbi:hypothetical protein BH11PSE10_BH11PSE10_12010 [soil metagenome]